MLLGVEVSFMRSICSSRQCGADRGTLSSVLDTNDLLAEVLAAQDADECSRRLREAVRNVLAVANLALLHPRGKGEDGSGIFLRPFPDEKEPMKRGRRQRAEDRERSHWLLFVVLRDESANRNARAGVQEGRHGLEHLASHVLEVDVDALRTGGPDRVRHARRPMVDADVEPELAGHIVALRGAARDADDSTTLLLCNLSDHRTDRP